MATDRATLEETYVAALQHDLADVSPEATRVGVVRTPTSWFHGAVDENIQALGPPTDLLEAVTDVEADLKLQGVCEEEAHNAAWEQVGFEREYRDYLEDSEPARNAIDDLERRLESGESLVLVCFENTAKKRCHRTILAERLAD